MAGTLHLSIIPKMEFELEFEIPQETEIVASLSLSIMVSWKSFIFHLESHTSLT
jgi:hypothetical protein